MMRSFLTIVSLLALVFVGVACGGSAAGQPSTVTQPSPTATVKRTSTLDAAAVVKRLKAAGLPIGTVVVYDATTDPNNLLGRPSQYTSKVAFQDTRLDPPTSETDRGVVNGGSVEVFEAVAPMQARATYLQAFASLAPEYDYTQGVVLLRLSHMLTPDQAKQYQDALAKLP